MTGTLGIGGIGASVPGAGEPAGVSRPRLGMWLFIASDALTFAALLFGTAYLRNANPDWPRPFEMWPGVAIATVMTLCLLGSGLAMSLAVQRAQAGEVRGAAARMGLAMGLGLVFLALHLWEWRHLATAGMRLQANPWGAPLFGGTFYTLTGFHMLHVAAGIVALGLVARRWVRGQTSAESVALCGLYWHFVELMWLFLFPLVYLSSVGRAGGA